MAFRLFSRSVRALLPPSDARVQELVKLNPGCGLIILNHAGAWEYITPPGFNTNGILIHMSNGPFYQPGTERYMPNDLLQVDQHAWLLRPKKEADIDAPPERASYDDALQQVRLMLEAHDHTLFSLASLFHSDSDVEAAVALCAFTLKLSTCKLRSPDSSSAFQMVSSLRSDVMSLYTPTPNVLDPWMITLHHTVQTRGIPLPVMLTLVDGFAREAKRWSPPNINVLLAASDQTWGVLLEILAIYVAGWKRAGKGSGAPYEAPPRVSMLPETQVHAGGSGLRGAFTSRVEAEVKRLRASFRGEGADGPSPKSNVDGGVRAGSWQNEEPRSAAAVSARVRDIETDLDAENEWRAPRAPIDDRHVADLRGRADEITKADDAEELMANLFGGDGGKSCADRSGEPHGDTFVREQDLSGPLTDDDKRLLMMLRSVARVYTIARAIQAQGIAGQLQAVRRMRGARMRANGHADDLCKMMETVSDDEVVKAGKQITVPADIMVQFGVSADDLTLMRDVPTVRQVFQCMAAEALGSLTVIRRTMAGQKVVKIPAPPGTPPDGGGKPEFTTQYPRLKVPHALKPVFFFGTAADGMLQTLVASGCDPWSLRWLGCFDLDRFMLKQSLWKMKLWGTVP